MPDDEFQPEDFAYSEDQQYLYELIDFHSDNGEYGDSTLHALFWDVMYNDELTYDQRIDLYQQLTVYLYESYGMDFESLWQWEDFRAWYDSV